MYSSIIVSESRGRGKRRGSSERNHILLYEILIQAKVDPEKASEVHNFLFFCYAQVNLSEYSPLGYVLTLFIGFIHVLFRGFIENL